MRTLVVALLLLGLPAVVHGQGTEGPPPSEGREVPLTAAQRQSLAGSYTVTLPMGEPGGAVRVVEAGEGLRVEADGRPPVRLIHQGENRFRPEGLPDFLFEFRVENGRATGFTVRRPDGTMRAVRTRSP